VETVRKTAAAAAAQCVTAGSEEEDVDLEEQQQQQRQRSNQPCKTVQELLSLLHNRIAGRGYIVVFSKWSEACGSNDLAVLFQNLGALLQQLDGSSSSSSSSSGAPLAAATR
jgi:hypothetical protein